MILVQRIGADRARYHAGGPGRWLGAGRGPLGLEGPVRTDALRAVLGGRDPYSGTPLPMTRTSRRRPGWELVIAAPKSLSLLAVLASEQRGAGGLGRALVEAHGAGVLAALEHLEVRATFFGDGGRPAGGGLVVAAFSHSANAAGEPHLHDHLVVANLLEAADRWRALDGRRLWWERRAADAVYSLAVRHHLSRSGFALAWRPLPGGGAEVEGIGRGAIEAASGRRHQAIVDASRWGTRRAQEVGRRRTRSTARERAPHQEWRARVAAAGLDDAGVARVVGMARAPGGRLTTQPAPPGPQVSAIPALAAADTAATMGGAGPDVIEEVERKLLGAGSRFREADVFPAIAEVVSPGAGPAQVRRWVAEVCARASPAGGAMFVSPLAAGEDRAVTAAALARAGVGAGVAARQLGHAGQGDCDSTAQAAVRRLVCDGHGVEVLGPPPTTQAAGEAPLLAQAVVVDAARRAWEAAGHRVRVVAQSAVAAARWEALTGLGAHHPEGPAPTVMIVDRADRMATPQLGSLLAEAAADAVKVVLVVGGTAPVRHQPRSAVLERLAAGLGLVVPGPPPDLGPPLPAAPAAPLSCPNAPPLSSPAGPPPFPAPAGPFSGPPHPPPSRAEGHPPASHPASRVLEDWRRADPSPERRPLMVAGGAAEAAALNRAARQRLAGDGQHQAPELAAGSLLVRAGERVMALRRRTAVPAGTLGTVEHRDGRAVVRWDQRPPEVVAPGGAPLGYGYATTPGYVRAGGPPILLLGPYRLLAGAGVGHQAVPLVAAHTAGLGADSPAPAGLDPGDPPARDARRLQRGVGMGIT